MPGDLTQVKASADANGRGTLRGVASSFARNSWALADQGLISASNFATLILLARGLSPSDFGAFVLAYTGLVLLNGIQSALITQPHNVLGQAHLGAGYPPYTTSTAAFQGAFALTGAALVVVAAGIVAQADSDAAVILLATVPALLGWQAQEFARRILYTETRFRMAFLTDLVAYGGQVVAFALLVAADVVTVPLALVVVGLTSAAGALVGVVAIRPSLGGRIRRDAVRENWHYGRWLAAGTVASWFVGQGAVYLVAVLIDAAASAGLKAAQVILGPLNVFFLFLATVLPIRLAATRKVAGDAGLGESLGRVFRIGALPVLAYCALTSVFAEPILTTLYGSEYAGYAGVVRILGVYYLVMYGLVLLYSALAARRQTRELFLGNLYGAVVALVTGWVCIEAWGVNGAALGMLFGAIAAAIMYWLTFRRPAEGPTSTTSMAVEPH